MLVCIRHSVYSDFHINGIFFNSSFMGKSRLWSHWVIIPVKPNKKPTIVSTCQRFLLSYLLKMKTARAWFVSFELWMLCCHLKISRSPIKDSSSSFWTYSKTSFISTKPQISWPKTYPTSLPISIQNATHQNYRRQFSKMTKKIE